jgi:GDPmannose 4,6-dehydratase
MSCLIEILKRCQPTEIYNLAGQSHVTLSFKIPEYTFQVNQGGCLNLLQAIVHCNLQSKTRLYQASTSELFRGDVTCALNETWPFEPQSPYAISKLSAYWLIRNYRATHGIFAVNGIAFNHESPRRSMIVKSSTFSFTKLTWWHRSKICHETHRLWCRRIRVASQVVYSGKC